MWWASPIPRKVSLSLLSCLTVGHVPLAFITATHSSPPPNVVKDLNNLVRKQIGGIASLAGVVVLERIPKTRSGKTLRRVLREIVERGMQGDWTGELAVPATVEDRSHVDWARDKVKEWMANQGQTSKKTTRKAKL